VRSRAIDAVLDGPSIDPRTLDLVRWIADYYQAPIGESMRVAFPPQSLTAQAARDDERMGDTGGRGEAVRVRLAAGASSAALPLDKRARRLRAILDTLASDESADGWMPLPALRARTEASSAHLRRLEEAGWIEIARGAAPAPGGGPGSGSGRPARAPTEAPVLTAPQARVARTITEAIDRGEARTFVLRGVTGSGKTEVYFAAARRALDRGRSVLFLVPEIALTPVFTRRVRDRFGEQVAVLHSRIPARERREAWERVRSGRAPLVVGPRSALFAPAGRLGLVVVDEEHDTSYKQEETPRYHARDIALVRAKLEGAVAVLGSATPSVETWHAAQSDRFVRLELPERIGGRPLPAVEIVDMREEIRRRRARSSSRRRSSTPWAKPRRAASRPSSCSTAGATPPSRSAAPAASPWDAPTAASAWSITASTRA
jgi:primosomal protein N' (replication factor Y)